MKGFPCQPSLILRCDQQNEGDHQSQSLNCNFIEPIHKPLKHDHVLDWFIEVFACFVGLIGLVVGGRSRSTSGVLLGILLFAIAFVLSQLVCDRSSG
jgi:hypothetical protein